MPIHQGSGHGDLYVEYNVVLPTSLSPDLKRRKLHLRCRPRTLIANFPPVGQGWLTRSSIRMPRMSCRCILRLHIYYSAHLVLQFGAPCWDHAPYHLNCREEVDQHTRFLAPGMFNIGSRRRTKICAERVRFRSHIYFCGRLIVLEDYAAKSRWCLEPAASASSMSPRYPGTRYQAAVPPV